MSTNGITWVGMDAHKNSIKVSALLSEPDLAAAGRRFAAALVRP